MFLKRPAFAFPTKLPTVSLKILSDPFPISQSAGSRKPARNSMPIARAFTSLSMLGLIAAWENGEFLLAFSPPVFAVATSTFFYFSIYITASLTRRELINCILHLISLAWAEMDLILTKIISMFDLDLVEERHPQHWCDAQKVYTVPEYLPLFIRIRSKL